MTEAEIALPAIAAALTLPWAIASMDDASTTSGGALLKLIWHICVTLMDCILQNLMKKQGKDYAVYMLGTLDPMSDNLIDKALVTGVISKSEITQAMYTSDKSQELLHT